MPRHVPRRPTSPTRRNGDTNAVRPIRPKDEPQHRAFPERLDPEDVRMRVFHTVRRLPRMAQRLLVLPLQA